MMLQRGARRLYDFLRGKAVGNIVPKAEIMQACQWKESTFLTYLGKNKLSHVLEEVDDAHMRVIKGGKHLDEDDFNAGFTQKR